MDMVYFSLAIILCFFMTMGVGASDLANVMSTTMGSKSLSVRQAVSIAIIFEVAGAFLGGSEVTETMREGIIHISLLNDHPLLMIEGMLGLLAACTVWMNLASFFGFPVSITNALVGSMVGFGTIVLGVDAIYWGQVKDIALGWFTSPIISGVVSYILFSVIQQTIFIKKNPLLKANFYIPLYLFLVGAILSFITVFKGLNHFNIKLNLIQDIVITLTTCMVITILGMLWIKHYYPETPTRRKAQFIQIEKYFAVLMAMTACAMIFAHGANDVSLTIAPLTIIYSLIKQQVYNSDVYPSWIILFGCSGVILGFLAYGRKVIETVGSSITALTPSRAFAATLSAATTVVSATSIGLPISATQTLVGAVLGVGMARGIGALNLRVIRNIFTSWILTLPAASILTITFYKFFNYILG